MKVIDWLNYPNCRNELSFVPSSGRHYKLSVTAVMSIHGWYWEWECPETSWLLLTPLWAVEVRWQSLRGKADRTEANIGKPEIVDLGFRRKAMGYNWINVWTIMGDLTTRN